MLTQPATRKVVQEWKAIWSQYRPGLTPNRKSAAEIIAYFRERYPLTEVGDARWKRVVIDNVMMNQCFAAKLPAGKSASARVYRVENSGSGRVLYEKQDAVFRGLDIHVGIEMETAFFHVEGSSLLWGRAVRFQGIGRRRPRKLLSGCRIRLLSGQRRYRDAAAGVPYVIPLPTFNPATSPPVPRPTLGYISLSLPAHGRLFYTITSLISACRAAAAEGSGKLPHSADYLSKSLIYAQCRKIKCRIEVNKYIRTNNQRRAYAISRIQEGAQTCIAFDFASRKRFLSG